MLWEKFMIFCLFRPQASRWIPDYFLGGLNGYNYLIFSLHCFRMSFKIACIHYLLVFIYVLVFSIPTVDGIDLYCV